MSLYFENGRQYITNALGQVVWDTNERDFISTTFLSGSIGLPPRSVTSANPANISTVTTIATGLPPECNAVLAMMDFNGGAGPWSIANGTFLGNFHFGGTTGGGTTINNWYWVRGIRALDFTASGGVVRLHERLLLAPASDNLGNSQTYTTIAQTLVYRLFVGSFV